MNIHLRKQRKITEKFMDSSLISPNSQLIIISNYFFEHFLCSFLHLKQIRKLRFNSKTYSFSPSSQQLAIGGSQGELQIIMIGSLQLVYKQYISNSERIQHIIYKNENILIAATAVRMQGSAIFQVDVKNNQIILIVKVCFQSFFLAYSHNHDVIFFLEIESKQLCIWSIQEGSKLFQLEERFCEGCKAIQLVDSKNLVLVKFYSLQMIFQLDYEKNQIHTYKQYIPKSIFGYQPSIIHNDQIITLFFSNQINTQVIEILFDQIDFPQTMTYGIQLLLKLREIAQFSRQNRLYLTIFAEHQQVNTHFYLIRIIKK